MNENLIIAAVGDKSCHRSWMKGEKKRFDMMLIYYGQEKDKFKEDAEYYLQSQTVGKLQKIYVAVDAFREKINGYKYIWLADDDIIASARTINRLFDKFRDYGLDAGQPAVKGGYVSHWITTRHLNCELRYIDFIESMCPLFKTEILLEKILPSFRINKSAWGIEWVWADALKGKKVGILDCVGVRHKKLSDLLPCLLSYDNNDYYRTLKKIGVSAADEYKEIVQKINPEARLSIFNEKGRVNKPLAKRILLAPLIVEEYCKWRVHFFLRKHLPIANGLIKKTVRTLRFAGGGGR